MEKIMDEQENFADKVIKSLKGSRAVDLTNTDEVAADITAQSYDFTAYGAQEGGGPGPGSGGNKDIVVLPGAGGVAGTSPSQINFYWNAPSTPDLTGIGQQVRTTIYNYASTATSPLLVIGGWDGSTNYVPSPTYGTGGATGTTAKIFINPFLGYITQDYMVLNNTSPVGAAIATTNSAGWMYYDNAQSKIRVGIGAGTAKTIAFTDDVTAASGLATTATSVQAVTATTSANHFILFSPQNGLVSGVAVSTDTTLTYNPSTDTLTVASVSGTATTSTNINVATTNTASTVYPVFSGAATTVTGTGLSSSGSLSYVPSTGTLSATTFSGAHTGNISGYAQTARNVDFLYTTDASQHYITFTRNDVSSSGAGLSAVATVFVVPSTGTLTASAFSGNLTGFATTGRNVNVVAATTNTAHPIMFTPASGTLSGAASSTVSTVTVNPSTGTVAATTFSGAFSGTASFAQTSRNIDVVAATTSASHPIVFTPATTGVSGAATSTVSTVFVNPSTSTISATTFSGALSGTATTATNVNIATTNTASTVYPVFSGAATTVTGTGLSSSGSLSYVPSTGVLSATTFSGAFTGNLTGYATTGLNVNVVAATTNTAHPIMFTPASGNLSGAATSTVSTVTVNPSTGTVAATTFSGAFSGTASFAQTARNIDVVAATTNASHPLVFTPATTGVSGAATSTVSTVSVNPSTSTITATTFSGALSGTATTSTNVNVATTNTASTVYPVFSGAATTVTGTGLSSNGSLSYVPSTGTLSATTFSGTFSGYANTSLNVNVVAATTNTNHPVMFTPAAGNLSGAATSTVSTVTINPSTATVTATTFSGTLSGYANTSNNVNVVSTTQNATHYFLFSPQSASVAGAAVSSDTTVTLNPSTNAMSLGSGSLVANNVRVGVLANTLDTSSGNLTIDSVGGTTNITDNLVVSGNLTVNGTTITVDSTISTLVDPILVIGSGVGGTQPSADDNKDRGIEFRYVSGTAATGFFGFKDSTEKFTFIPRGTNTGEVFSGAAGTAVFATVEGNLLGNVFGNVTGNLTGNVTGTATTGQNVNVVSTAQNGFHSLLFSPATTSVAGAAVSSGVGLTYNPSTQTLYATNFVGTVTGTISGVAQTANNLSVVTTTSANNHYLTFTPASTSITGMAVSTVSTVYVVPSSGTVNATAFSGAFTGNLTGYATTANNLNLVAATTNASHPIVFTPATGTASGAASSTVSTVTVNPSNGTITATTFSGAFTGNISGYAQTSRNVDVVAATTSANHPIMFTPATAGVSGAATSTVSTVFVNPSTSTVSATTFSGSLSGTATTATNLNIATTNTASTVYPVFSGAATTVTGTGLSSNGSLSYVPSTGTLTATTFSGAHTGNLTGYATTGLNINVVAATTNTAHPVMFTPASGNLSGAATSTVSTVTVNPSTGTVAATTFSGAFTGNLTGYATTGLNVNVVAATTNTAHPIMFTPASGSLSGAATSTVSTVTINPSNGTVTATTFSGAFSGTASFAQTSRNIDVVAATTSANHPIVFTPATTGVSGAATSTVSTVSVNPSTSTVTATTFSGALSGTATTATNINIATTNTASTMYPVFSGAATTVTGTGVSSSGSLSYVPSTGTLTATTFSGAFTGNLSGYATTGLNVNVVAATTNTNHPVMFTPASGNLSGAATSTVSTVTVNPSTGTVTATTFSGAFTGNISGYAQTARNVDSVVANSAGNHFLLLSPQSGVSGAAVSTDSNLYYVPTTDTLNVSTLSGTGVTVTASAALTNGTYFTIKTVSGDDNNNVDFFIRGTSSDNTSRFSVDTAGNLRATTKSFDIEHPTKPGKRLVYGVLEGPEHGVYHRGTVEGKGKLEVELPEYWSKLVNEDYSIQLTSWGNYNVHIVEKTNNSFIIELTGNPLSQKFKVIKVDYVVHGSRKDAPLEIEQ